MNREVDRIGRLSVRTVSLAVFFLLTFPLIVLLGVGSIRTMGSIQAQEELRQQDAFQSSMHQMDVELQKVESFMTSTLLESEALQELQYSTDPVNTYLSKAALYSSLGGFLSQNLLVDGVCVYIPQTDCYLEKDNGFGLTEYQTRQEIRSSVWHSMETQSTQSSPGDWTAMFCADVPFLYRISSFDGASIMCVVRLSGIADWMEEQALVDMTVEAYDGETCVLPSAEKISDTKTVQQEAYGLIWMADIRQTNAAEYASAKRFTQLQMMVAMIGTAFFIVVFGFWRRSFLLPLHALKQTMEKIQRGDLETQAMTRHAGREMDEINTTFNNMIYSIRTLKIESYEKELAKKQAQMDFYKAQIRPHFYLNCLKNIYSLAKEKKTEQIGQSILLLADYLRYTIQQNETVVPIHTELEQCREYVRLFGLSASFPPELRIDEDPAASSCMIPPLSVLTLLENALKHTPSGQRTVHIEIQVNILRAENGDTLHIAIRDDGFGFPEDVADQLNNMDWETAEGTHLGLKNVIRRLYLIYGKENVFAGFYSDHGAAVELFLPSACPEMGGSHESADC